MLQRSDNNKKTSSKKLAGEHNQKDEFIKKSNSDQHKQTGIASEKTKHPGDIDANINTMKE